jgi:deazaflavin-dependent oxidoreductase (nitroreductase family)
MPAPRWVARANRVGLNRVVGLFAPRVPGFGMVEHRGRRSGRVYRTPVNVFRRDNGYVIALTYGPESDWVQNVLSAGACRLETRGNRVDLGAPKIIRDDRRSAVPAVIRAILRLARVNDFLTLEPITVR